MRAGTPSVAVIVSNHLPISPSHGEQARRLVRHGMADILAWLGEDVGPEPDAMTHVVLGMDPAHPGHTTICVSREFSERTDEWWTLDHTDYTNEGSVQP